MQIGDIVRHYSCGGKLQLGIVLDMLDCDMCKVLFPDENKISINDYREYQVISTWENLTSKVQGNLVYVDDLVNKSILSN